jgi:hypothetical protein
MFMPEPPVETYHLMRKFYDIFTIFGGPARFYHRLAYMLYNILNEGGYFDALYNILDEDGYLYEDN